MAKKKKVKSETEEVKKPVVNQLKSINKQEKKKAKQSNNKSKSKFFDSVIDKLKGKKKVKSDDATVQIKKKQNVKENDNQNLINKQDSNQNEKKKKKQKSKKTKELTEKSEICDKQQQQSPVQEDAKAQETKKKKRRKRKKSNVDSTVAAESDKKKKKLQVANGKVKKIKNKNNKKSSDSAVAAESDEKKKKLQVANRKVKKIKNKNNKKSSDVLKRLDINRLSSIFEEEEESEKNKAVIKRPTSPLSLRDRMMAQLKASRFRFLNEQMYSSQSSQSKKFFQDDPQAFYAYHEGYKHQVERWPLNPLDVIIESISKMPKNYVIADFGCGEAKLADSVPQTVHSFDLVAVNDKVKACDMANTPLLTGRANVVVFCLSLMGSNLGDYLLEANRVLEINGILKIAEVESRFDKLDDFIKTMANYGFAMTWHDLSHNLFYFMDFKKTKDVLKKDIKKLPPLTLKPCLYKKR